MFVLQACNESSEGGSDQDAIDRASSDIDRSMTKRAGREWGGERNEFELLDPATVGLLIFMLGATPFVLRCRELKGE
jgi:hypothetical protein